MKPNTPNPFLPWPTDDSQGTQLELDQIQSVCVGTYKKPPPPIPRPSVPTSSGRAWTLCAVRGCPQMAQFVQIELSRCLAAAVLPWFRRGEKMLVELHAQAGVAKVTGWATEPYVATFQAGELKRLGIGKNQSVYAALVSVGGKAVRKLPSPVLHQ